MKRSMLANEGMRRLLNMSPDLPWEAFVDVMNEFAVKMWKRGYPASGRAGAGQGDHPPKVRRPTQ